MSVLGLDNLITWQCQSIKVLLYSQAGKGGKVGGREGGREGEREGGRENKKGSKRG